MPPAVNQVSGVPSNSGSTSMPCVCVVCVIGDCACGYPGGNGANGGVGFGKLFGFAQSSVGSTASGCAPVSWLR